MEGRDLVSLPPQVSIQTQRGDSVPPGGTGVQDPGVTALRPHQPSPTSTHCLVCGKGFAEPDRPQGLLGAVCGEADTPAFLCSPTFTGRGAGEGASLSPGAGLAGSQPTAPFGGGKGQGVPELLREGRSLVPAGFDLGPLLPVRPVPQRGLRVPFSVADGVEHLLRAHPHPGPRVWWEEACSPAGGQEGAPPRPRGDLEGKQGAGQLPEDSETEQPRPLQPPSRPLATGAATAFPPASHKPRGRGLAATASRAGPWQEPGRVPTHPATRPLRCWPGRQGGPGRGGGQEAGTSPAN